MAFTLEEKQQIITLLNLTPADLGMVSDRCSALETTDTTQGTTFVIEAQDLIEEIVSDSESLVTAQKNSGYKSIQAPGDEMTVTYADTPYTGLAESLVEKRNRLAKLLGISLAKRSSGVTSVTMQNLALP